MVIRPAKSTEAFAISQLALRSKGHWGYSHEFLEACRAELTYDPSELENTRCSFVVAEESEVIVGFYALEYISEDEADLAALFVELKWIGRGIGRALMNDAKDRAKKEGRRRITIQSDPYAADFYHSMGAQSTGASESASIPGRYLPTFTIRLEHGDTT